MTNALAGWYDDGSGRTRYWNGAAWTEHILSTEAVPGAPRTDEPSRSGQYAGGTNQSGSASAQAARTVVAGTPQRNGASSPDDAASSGENAAGYEFKTVRVIRGWESPTASKWEKTGWEVVARNGRILRTELTLRRHRPKTVWHSVAAVGRALSLAARRIPMSLWIVGGILVLLLVSSISTSGIGGALVVLGIAAVVTGLYTVVSGRRSWAMLPSRTVGAIVAAGSVAAIMLGSVLVGPSTVATPTAESAPTASASAHVTPAPTTSPIPTSELDPAVVKAPAEAASVAVANASATENLTALAVLETLPVKGRAPKTGYARTAEFGAAWLDADRNGCDTRNDVLARDLTSADRPGGCRVLSGELADPYTGSTIEFIRGNTTSTAVQIDHVVALMNAWETGAQQLSRAQRISFANDPINLLAVDGVTNAAKGDGDAATWLPPVKTFRCDYVARQVSVKATYHLWVTQAEHDAIAKILTGCPTQLAYTSTFAPATPTPTPTPTVAPDLPEPVPAPAPPAPEPEPAPAPAPAVPDTGGATALCNDGTLSFAQHHQGACSHHGGVSVFYK